MKAVFLDAGSLGDDVDLSPIREQVSLLEAWPNTDAAERIKRLHDTQIVISNKVMLDAETLEASPSLKLICVTATGMNNVDLNAAERLGIAVRNVTAYGTDSVAQHTMMLMLALANRLPLYQSDIAAGHWQQSSSFCLMGYRTLQLRGKHLVIVGSGELGSRVAQLAKAFGMNVSFCARPGRENSDSRPTLASLAPDADVISLHCPLNEHTQNLISAALIDSLKPGCLLINCSRGGLIDDRAALVALRKGKLGGMGVDVLPEEPPRNGHLLLDAIHEQLNLIVTPHNAWITPEARQALVDKTAENLRAFQQQS
jgi:glycerate dehydrogenase